MMTGLLGLLELVNEITMYKTHIGQLLLSWNDQ